MVALTTAALSFMSFVSTVGDITGAINTLLPNQPQQNIKSEQRKHMAMDVFSQNNHSIIPPAGDGFKMDGFKMGGNT